MSSGAKGRKRKLEVECAEGMRVRDLCALADRVLAEASEEGAELIVRGRVGFSGQVKSLSVEWVEKDT